MLFNTALLFALTSRLVSAQPTPGYGRYPCTVTNPDGTLSSAGDDYCAQVLSSTRGFPSYYQLAGCTLQPTTGYYFCAIEGATCDVYSPLGRSNSAGNCDGGYCDPATNTCVGGFGQYPSPQSGQCLGNLVGAPVTGQYDRSGLCGGINAQCFDGDGTCASNYCAPSKAPDEHFTRCAEHLYSVGDDCTFDPARACGSGLYASVNPVSGKCTCQLGPQPSQRTRTRAKARRATICPAGYSACPVGDGSNKNMYECIDVESDLEQCGGCLSTPTVDMPDSTFTSAARGVDCTALEGVSAVGCVRGKCEIRACEAEGSWEYDAERGACAWNSDVL